MEFLKTLRSKSIINYLLYIWQQEDTIRALGLDIEKIKEIIINADPALAKEGDKAVEWYDNLIAMMINEGKREAGHLQFSLGLIGDLNDLHMKLLSVKSEIAYNAAFYQVLPALIEFRQKNKSGAEVNDVELALTALYLVMLLKIKGQAVSDETLSATKQIAQFLTMLAKKYEAYENDELTFDED